VAQGWDWHRLWGVMPIFPRFTYACERHLPPRLREAGAGDDDSRDA
jgi:hypothetical protein